MPAYHIRMAFQAHQTTSNALTILVLHAEVDTLTSPPNWASVATDVKNWLGTEFNNMLTTNDHFDQVTVTDENYPGSTHGQGVAIGGTGGARSVPDTSLSPAICAVASWKTAVAKRYARGHNFMPPAYVSSAATAGGNWLGTNAYWTSCVAFGQKYVAGFTAGSTSYVPEVFSPHLVLTGVTPFTNKVVGWNLDGKQHFLRSRATSP